VIPATRPVAVAAAAAAVALTGCGGGTTAVHGGPTPATIPLAANQLVLTPAESRRLLGWVERLRACLVARAVQVGELRATRKQVTLPVDRSLARRVLVRDAVACGAKLGGPPRQSSLQAFRGRVIVYLPRACILDAKVAASAAKPGG
jgi:hypothetical protein